MNEDELDSKGRNFGNEDATECIGDGRVDAEEGEGGNEMIRYLELDSDNMGAVDKCMKGMDIRRKDAWEYLFEFLQTP